MLRPRGAFSLEESARFGFGQRHDTDFDGTMRLAFCVDGYRAQVAVHLQQDGDGDVLGTIDGMAGDAPREVVARQVARMLSLDHDATGFEAVARRDPRLAGHFAVARGLRPPLFHSPYEAALWSVLSARRGAPTARVFRARLAEHAGARFEAAGVTVWAVPLPHRIVELEAAGVRAVTGVEAQRAERVVAVARAAIAGELDAETLRSQPNATALRGLRTIPGIGRFYANLILIRATGVTDVLATDEPRLAKLVGRIYDLGRSATPAELERIGEGWAPFRTWVSVLVRAVTHRVFGDGDEEGLSRRRTCGIGTHRS